MTRITADAKKKRKFYYRRAQGRKTHYILICIDRRAQHLVETAEKKHPGALREG